MKRAPRHNFTKSIPLSFVQIPTEAYNKIGKEAFKMNISNRKMVEIMIDFYFRNYIIVEQLSLTSKNIT